MKLFNSLFQVSDESEVNGIHHCKITLDATHVTYKGHFPGFPVTPGVVQIQIVEELLEYKLGKGNYILKSTNQCKFLKVIDPEKTNSLAVSYSFVEEGTQVDVKASFQLNDVVFFKFSGRFENVE
jgi:3-hydroxyacyl-[acyl-carrier-protein] dehydratase